MDALYFFAWFLFIFVLLPMMGAMFAVILAMAYEVIKYFTGSVEEFLNNKDISTDRKYLIQYLFCILLGLVLYFILDWLVDIYNNKRY